MGELNLEEQIEDTSSDTLLKAEKRLEKIDDKLVLTELDGEASKVEINAESQEVKTTTGSEVESVTTEIASKKSQGLVLGKSDQWDIVASREELMNSPKVIALTDEINLNDSSSILSFGKEVADEIKDISDIMLKSINPTIVDSVKSLAKRLDRVMDQVDIRSYLNKIETNAKKRKGLLYHFIHVFRAPVDSLKALEDLVNSVQSDIEKISEDMFKFKDQLEVGNKSMEELITSSMDYYSEMEEYIAAGYLCIRKINDHIKQQETNPTEDKLAKIKIDKYKKAVQLIDRRIHDLEYAQTLVLSTIPVIQSGIDTNIELIRSIESAQTTTIPAFKQGIMLAFNMKQTIAVAKAKEVMDNAEADRLEMLARNVNVLTDIRVNAMNSTCNLDKLEGLFEAVKDSNKRIAEAAANQSASWERDRINILHLKADWKGEQSSVYIPQLDDIHIADTVSHIDEDIIDTIAVQ